MNQSHNIARYLPHMARERPDQPAIIVGAGCDRAGKVIYQQLTFAELDRESDAYAWGLTTYGIERGTRVLLMVRPGLPLISLTFALFKAGCVPIVIDPAMGRQNLAQCIAECEPEALIGVERAQIARLVLRRAFRSVRLSVTVGRRWFWDGATLAQLRIPLQTPFELAQTTTDETAAILFTTGSTGVPKGVVYAHGMFEAQVQIIRTLYGIEPGEVEMPAFPLFSLFNVALGLTSAIPDLDPTRPAQCDPRKIIELIEDQQVTSSFGSPAIWRRVADYCLRQQIRLPTLRRVLMAGAPVPAALHNDMHQILRGDADTHAPYGATEALPIVSFSGREVLAAQAEHNDPISGTCIGRPAPGMTLRIIPIHDQPIATWHDTLALPPGSIGEITVKGPVVTREYIHRPESTRLAKIADGDAIWHRMGDVGYFDHQGRLWFYGRKSQRVILADRTLYTEPCELVFNRHPLVRRSALVGIDAADGAQRPVMVIELHDRQLLAQPAEQARIRAELLALGAAHPVTAGIDTLLFYESFPVDIRHNAKIFREKLAVWAASELAKPGI
ncbi:MAG TPA: fatty acid CoA ligase family protein [Roseiflexaceae bacterium]|nr:fatty acid CoA ligase family protein [Roseiflexaceae bacterium]